MFLSDEGINLKKSVLQILNLTFVNLVFKVFFIIKSVRMISLFFIFIYSVSFYTSHFLLLTEQSKIQNSISLSLFKEFGFKNISFFILIITLTLKIIIIYIMFKKNKCVLFEYEIQIASYD